MSEPLKVDGIWLALDPEGYLCDWSSWSPEAATALAEQCAWPLSPRHWEVLDALRVFYQRFETTPNTRVLVKYLQSEQGMSTMNSIELMKLFGDKPLKLACRLAGLPKPTNCV